VDAATLPAEVAQTFDLDGVLDGETTVELGEAENRDDVDFGYQPLGSIGDRVWLDDDRDGVQDAGEPGLSGVVVELRDSAGGLLASQTTGADGEYLFGGLSQGKRPLIVFRLATRTKFDVLAVFRQRFDHYAQRLLRRIEMRLGRPDEHCAYRLSWIELWELASAMYDCSENRYS